MRPFPRDQEATEAVPADDVPFQSLLRAPLNARKARKPRGAADPDFDPGSPLDPADASKTRARRRLIGAIALALAAIVFVPMLFDRTPVPPADDISLQIPDRDSPFEGRRGVPDPSRAPLRPSSDLPTIVPTPIAPAPSTPSTPTTPVPDASSSGPPSGTAETADATKSDVESTTRAATKPVERTTPAPIVEKLAEKPRATTGPAASSPGDDPRAIAALEGRTPAPTQTPTPADGGAKSYAVQIAAFSTVDKAKSLRDHLVANGLKSYTESVSTSQGFRTRVRLGPFASRDAADRAKQKLKTMKLDGSVVSL